MEIKASTRYLRISPRKVRLVAGLIRGKKIQAALDQLKFSPKGAAGPMLKLVNSAVANADHNFEIKADNLYIKTLTVDGGPTLKRWLPRAHGRATPLNRRTSHIKITLAEITPGTVKAGKNVVAAAPIKLSELVNEAKGESGKVKGKDKGKVKGEDKKEGRITEEMIKDNVEQKPVDKTKLGSMGHTKIEGGKGLTRKIFRRKSG